MEDKSNFARLTISLNPFLLRRVRIAAAKESLSMSSFCALLISTKLDEIEKSEVELENLMLEC